MLCQALVSEQFGNYENQFVGACNQTTNLVGTVFWMHSWIFLWPSLFLQVFLTPRYLAIAMEFVAGKSIFPIPYQKFVKVETTTSIMHTSPYSSLFLELETRAWPKFCSLGSNIALFVVDKRLWCSIWRLKMVYEIQLFDCPFLGQTQHHWMLQNILLES